MVKLYRTERRRRRRAMWAFLRTMLMLAVVAGLAVYVFYQGVRYGDKERVVLAEETARLNEELSTSQNRTIVLERELASSQADVEDWQARYESDVPQGEARELYDNVRNRLAAGVPSERIAFLLKSAKKDRTCDTTLVSARFGVQLAGQDNLTRPVAFGKGRVRVLVSGEPLVAVDGSPVVYDPGKPITISVADISGTAVTETGPLPMRASIVAGASEYRFLVEEETGGLVRVTAERCNYP